MKACRTDESNLTLTLPGAGADRNLPAQRILAFDPELGETEKDAHQAIQTTWLPDEGERRALANGAPIKLIVHMSQHPPVSMSVGEPQELEALISKAHVDRAVGYLYLKLAEALAGDGLPDAEGTLEMWHEALEETRDGQMPVDAGQKLEELRERLDEPPANGNGESEEK